MSLVPESKNVDEKIFEHNWMIKNWSNVFKNEELVNTTKTVVLCMAESVLYAEFEVGIKKFKQHNNIRFYWKLLRKHQCLENVNVNMVIDTLNREGKPFNTFQVANDAVIGKTVDVDWNFFPFAWEGDISSYISFDGSMVIRLTVALKDLPSIAFCSKKEFTRVSADELIENFSALLNDKCSSDIKILTKDEYEFFAHKTILRARCPVFPSLIQSECFERNTCTVKVDDISAKTMKILLKYWYTGEWIPSWEDEDIVVEFTYAAGKYQLTQVLKMLDGLLGSNDKHADQDVELLKMAQAISLIFAEARLLKRLIHKISNITKGADFLAMFGLTNISFNEEKFAASQIFKSFDNLLSNQSDKVAGVLDIKFLALACKLNMKNVETKFLQRIVGTVKKLSSADQLFALVDIQTEATSDDIKHEDLLVRASLSSKSVS